MYALAAAPDPGEDRPGNWYHDRKQPYVDLGGVTPRLHWQVGCDEKRQTITDTRGLVTLATDSPGAALVEGQVTVQALTECPTRQDNYAVAIAAQAWPPATPLDKPFTWTRRVLYVKAAKAAGMNYVVVRDDFGGFDQRTPNFNCWWFADEVELAARSARYTGQFGVDMDLYVAVPAQVKLYKDAFVHDQCEPIVAGRHQAKFGKAFSEKQVLCRVEGQNNQGFLVVLFPYKPDEPRPVIENWEGAKGVRVAWKGETHYILFDTRQHEIDADGIEARADCLVIKVMNGENFTLDLPAGGQLTFRGQKLEGSGPLETAVVGGEARESVCTDLMTRSP